MPDVQNKSGMDAAENASSDDMFESFCKQCSAYKRELIALAVIVVVGGAVYAAAQYMQKKAETQAWTAYEETKVSAGPMGPQIDAEKLSAAIAAHADTQAAAYMRLKLIQLLADDGEVEKAVAQAQSFLKTYPNHTLFAQAQLALAQLLMRQDKYDEAKTVIKQAMARIQASGQTLLEPELKLAHAQCLEMEAEARRDSPEYVSYLDAARDAYLDIRSRANWPPAIVRTADFAIVAIQERMRAAKAGEPVPVVQPLDEGDEIVPPKPGDSEAKGDASVPEEENEDDAGAAETGSAEGEQPE